MVRKSDLSMIMKRTGSVILFEILIASCGVQSALRCEGNIYRKTFRFQVCPIAELNTNNGSEFERISYFLHHCLASQWCRESSVSLNTGETHSHTSNDTSIGGLCWSWMTNLVQNQWPEGGSRKEVSLRRWMWCWRQTGHRDSPELHHLGIFPNILWEPT